MLCIWVGAFLGPWLEKAEWLVGCGRLGERRKCWRRTRRFVTRLCGRGIMWCGVGRGARFFPLGWVGGVQEDWFVG